MLFSGQAIYYNHWPEYCFAGTVLPNKIRIFAYVLNHIQS